MLVGQAHALGSGAERLENVVVGGVTPGQRRERRVPSTVPPEPLHGEIDRLLGDSTVRRDLAAQHRDEAIWPTRAGMVADRVPARDLTGLDAFFANEGADAGHAVVDRSTLGAREDRGGLAEQV